MPAILIMSASILATCSLLDPPQPEYAAAGDPISSTDAPAQSAPIRVTGEQALEMSSGDIIIVDVRNRDEFDAGHIEHAILLPVDEIASRVSTVLPDKNQAILLYCRSGARSSRAALVLVEMGYTRVYDLGAFTNWQGSVIYP